MTRTHAQPRTPAPRPRRFPRAPLAALLLLLPGAVAGMDAEAAVLPAPDAGLEEHYRDFELQVMEPHAFRALLATGAVDVTLRGKAYRLLVEPAPWNASYRLAVPQADGTRAFQAPAFEPAVYLGRVAGEASSRVTVVVTGTGVSAHVRTPHDDVQVNPLRFLRPDAPPGVSVVYAAHEVAYPEGLGAHEEPLFVEPTGPSPGGGLGVATYAPGPNRRVTLWADEELLASSPGAVDQVWSAFNKAKAEMRAMLGWEFTVVNDAVYACTATQCPAGGTSSDVLRAFANSVNVAGQSWSSYEVAHLFTGKDVDVGGLAYQPGRYGFTAVTGYEPYIVELSVAHELSHNFNARHARAQSYTHMHGGTAVTHHTLMGQIREHAWPYATIEVKSELSSANVNWVRACNLHSWTGGTRTPNSYDGFGDRCYTNVQRLENGGAGPDYDATPYRGKLFTGTERGTVERVCIRVDQAGTATLAFKALPNGEAPRFTVTVNANGPGQHCANPDVAWPGGTMFVYKTGGTARIGADNLSSRDSFFSVNNGATWAADDARRGISVDILRDTMPVEACGVLASGASLARDQSIRSCNNRYVLIHQMDGNVVLYDNGRPLWRTDTVGATTSLLMQGDGNLVLYNGPIVVWASHTGGNPGAWVSLRDDGVAMMYATSGATLWHAGCGVLPSGASLARNREFLSCDGRFRFAHAWDGNLVLYQGNAVLWASGTNGKATTTLNMQPDGNLVLYDGGTPVWWTGTAGAPGSTFLVRDDGNAVVETRWREVAWQTNTRGT